MVDGVKGVDLAVFDSREYERVATVGQETPSNFAIAYGSSVHPIGCPKARRCRRPK
jgi:hypothetical protein